MFSMAGIQEKLGILNGGEVYAVFSYDAQQPDELNFSVNDRLVILRKGDDAEREWWWARLDNSTGSGSGIGGENEGYVPRNLLGVSVIIGHDKYIRFFRDKQQILLRSVVRKMIRLDLFVRKKLHQYAYNR